MTTKEQILSIEAAISAATTVAELDAIDIPSKFPDLIEDRSKKRELLRKEGLVTFTVTVASTLLWNNDIDAKKWAGNIQSAGDIRFIQAKLKNKLTPIPIDKIEQTIGSIAGMPVKGVKPPRLMQALQQQERKNKLTPSKGVVYIIEVETREEHLSIIRVANLDERTMEKVPHLDFISVNQPIRYTLLDVAIGTPNDLDQGYEDEQEAINAFALSIAQAKEQRNNARSSSNNSKEFDSAFESEASNDLDSEPNPQPPVEEASEVI